MNFKKYLSVLIYLLAGLIGLNLYLKNQNNYGTEEKFFYQKLFDIGYYKEAFNPYSKAAILEVDPTNYFSLPLNKKDRESINNKVLTLNKNGFRYTPYNSQSKIKKKCILFLGSSASFGVGSSSDELTLPAIINKKLGSEYYVYNLSIPSWNSRQELISLLNFLNYEEFNRCLNINTISFSGTTDLVALESLKKSPIFKVKDLRKNLYSSPQYFPKLEELVKVGTRTKKEFKYNINTTSRKLFELLFGELIKIAYPIEKFKNKNDINLSNKKDNNLQDKYLIGQLKSFISNQKTIKLITNNLGGKHLLVLQPNLKNAKSDEQVWLNKNNTLTSLIEKEICLNTLDLRNYFNNKQAKYVYKDQLVSMSLEDSIKRKLFKEQDLNKHYFFDNSHLTNLGNSELATVILKEYLKNPNQKDCPLNKISLD